jgi:uncharacterized membrane protein YqgA involved in biofilm formation
MAMGITLIVKLHSLPPVVIATILGAVVGEVLALEVFVNRAAARARSLVDRLMPQSKSPGLPQEQFLLQFVAVLVLFCASGTDIFGSMNEGITGDASLLLAKPVLDFFTAAIFAATLGLSVATIALPQFIIQMTLFFLGGMILPLTTENMTCDFPCCGGIIMLATGLRIANIKAFPMPIFSHLCSSLCRSRVCGRDGSDKRRVRGFLGCVAKVLSHFFKPH